MTTKRIAVVDDDPSVRRAIIRSVRSLSYTGESFASGDELLASDIELFDCLIVDLHMPKMGGIELLERLVALGIFVPSVVVTARAQPAIFELAQSHGAVRMLLKPFDLASLEGCIRHALHG